MYCFVTEDEDNGGMLPYNKASVYNLRKKSRSVEGHVLSWLVRYIAAEKRCALGLASALFRLCMMRNQILFRKRDDDSIRFIFQEVLFQVTTLYLGVECLN
jgi:hypothetical protein